LYLSGWSSPQKRKKEEKNTVKAKKGGFAFHLNQATEKINDEEGDGNNKPTDRRHKKKNCGSQRKYIFFLKKKRLVSVTLLKKRESKRASKSYLSLFFIPFNKAFFSSSIRQYSFFLLSLETFLWSSFLLPLLQYILPKLLVQFDC
jgi:hypothetical protein